MSPTAVVVPIRSGEPDVFDVEALRLPPEAIPSVKVETGAGWRRKAARQRLFVPATAWPELATVISAGVSGRSVGLWLAIRMQAKLDGTPWVRVRTHLRASLGFSNRAAHSRAVAELEQAGLIEVQRRKGYAPLVRLVPQCQGDMADE